MAQRLADKRGDRAPELKKAAELIDKLRTDLFTHIQKEENVLFPFIAQMGQESIIAYPPAHACIHSVLRPIFMMEQKHEFANRIMAELHSLAAGLAPPEWACATHIAFLAALSEFGTDLKQHVHMGNDVLFPSAMKLEAELNRSVSTVELRLPNAV